MRDVFGQNLAVGDEVAFMEPQYRNLLIGIIIRITPQNVRVSYRKGGREHDFLTPGHCVAKRPGQA